MSYQATVFNVMIASPSDVADERETVRSVILNWNYIHSISRRIVLIPLGWETHSAPLLGEEDRRGQGVINKQVLKHADLLVAIFESRIGSHTGNEISGTIEEIQLHQSAGKPVQVYFGLEIEGEEEQIRKVLAYKEQCKKVGLIGEYSNCDDLKSQFQNHLPQVINGHGYFIQKSAREVLTPTEDRPFSFNSKVKNLLIEASKDKDGHIMLSEYIGEDVYVETNRMRFFDLKTDLLGLVREGYLREVDEGRVYSITDLGYQKIGELKIEGL